MANTSQDFSQLNISEEEKDKLVAEVIRYVLFKTHQNSGCPIKRDELTQIVTKNYHQRLLPALVINEAIAKLSSIFGFEMRELQRSRPSSTNQQKQLWHHLRRMGLHETDESNPVLGNIKQALEMLVQQRYLQKDKVNGPEGNTLVYELAERALDGPVNDRIKEYISQIVKNEVASVEID
uniref:MAGE domain-containing protein n=1 Tax=Manihot esculenta TaxID=3983 RepID=A0A2C9U1D8_MANES